MADLTRHAFDPLVDLVRMTASDNSPAINRKWKKRSSPQVESRGGERRPARADSGTALQGISILSRTCEMMPQMRIDWKIDLGHIVTFGVLIIGFAAQYGSLSNRLSVVEAQAAKASQTSETLNATLVDLRNTLTKVQTQMDEREKRYDVSRAKH